MPKYTNDVLPKAHGIALSSLLQKTLLIVGTSEMALMGTGAAKGELFAAAAGVAAARQVEM